MKKHFLLLGKAGLIYFSWLFILLFIGLILAYEGTAKINWSAIIIIVIFLGLLIYTWFASYCTTQVLKLPYRGKLKLKQKAKIIWQWKFCQINQLKVDDFHTFYYLTRLTKKQVQ
ncbi:MULTISPECIES: acyltransferase [Lactobacillus]|uniref:Acyltransferase n=1 Tax=Lactobacillus xujianguonis TaxID=2495899 RepID=A0A437SXZ3_9LACO|nr:MULTISPECIES: acyltransferase [Lactobacillus]RVU71740.1 acyltransferase [Lactobacillus xujianguonis]RVU77570.1 acyltransferase [Lactobacillus xujianguonis]